MHTLPAYMSAKVCTHDHEKVRAVGEDGQTELYIMNKVFFPKMNKLMDETDMDTFKARLSADCLFVVVGACVACVL